MSMCLTVTTYHENEKLGQRGSGTGHVTYFWNFGTACLSRERFALETSNLACRLNNGGINDKNKKLRQGGREKVTWPTFEILGPLLISETVWAIETSNLACRLTTTNETRSSAIAKSTARPSCLVGVLYDIYRETINISTAKQPLVRNWPRKLSNSAK